MPPKGLPLPSNYITNPHALNVHKAQVGDEGKEYSRGMTVAVCRQIVWVKTPLFDELQKCAEGHRVHLKSGLYFCEANIPHM